MTVISSRSTTTVGSPANQPSGSRPANQSAASLASGLLGLLPTAGAAGALAVDVMVSHDYMITPLQT